MSYKLQKISKESKPLLKSKGQNRWQRKDKEADDDTMTLETSGETDILSQNKEIVGHFEGKHYITRSGRVSKRPQRPSYHIDIKNLS